MRAVRCFLFALQRKVQQHRARRCVAARNNNIFVTSLGPQLTTAELFGVCERVIMAPRARCCYVGCTRFFSNADSALGFICAPGFSELQRRKLQRQQQLWPEIKLFAFLIVSIESIGTFDTKTWLHNELRYFYTKVYSVLVRILGILFR